MDNGEHKIDDWRIAWDGAYVCKSLGYGCGQADFAPEIVEEDDALEVASAVGAAKIQEEQQPF